MAGPVMPRVVSAAVAAVLLGLLPSAADAGLNASMFPTLDFVPVPAEEADVAVELATGLVVSSERLPLRTNGRYIVDRLGGRVKWSCVNWHGGQQQSWVMGGLQAQPVRKVAARIASLGFNCVRLSYSTEAVVHNPMVPHDRLTANPQLYNKTFLECLDAVVAALSQEHVMMILNNHMSKAGWCCNINQDEGLWYTPEFNSSQWQTSLVTIAARYRNNLWVVAHDLRNEPHSYNGLQPVWGGGDPATDYKMAMQNAGNAVLAVNPDTLIVIEGLCFGMELRFIKHSPMELDLPNKIVYEVHNYQEFQFSTLFTSHFYAWSFVRSIIGTVAGVLVAVFLLVCYSCHRLRWPWAPRGVFLVTFGSWITAVCVPSLAGAITAYIYYMKYCNYIAELDIKYYVHLAAWGTVMGIILLVLGFVRYGTCGKEYTRLCTPDTSPESRRRRSIEIKDSDDEGSSEISEDEAEADSGVGLGGPDLSEDEPELACLKSFVRAKVRTPGGGGPCCFQRCGSCRLLGNRTIGNEWRKRTLARAEWDCGICCLWQMFCGIPALLAVLLVLWAYALTAPMYRQLESEFDRKWGFVLQNGHPYTAPVWMGEFGAGAKGTYWVNFVRYLAERDLDFAYWPLNPDKLATGWFDDWGKWTPYDSGARWDEDSYSILDSDWVSVREPWRVLDLRPLMKSPAGAVLNTQPCLRDVLGRVCGG
mmetsp:Transcript_18511/g.51523  ORF Transcript_18511/g.51523 Transcript_18511/m.51523 type:complete len:702 (-) Transcript_18511:157-2262(-)